MNGGTGQMTVRMYNDEKYRIIPTTIHRGGSIGMHRQTSGDDMNYVLSGIGKAICDGVEEELKPGSLHICPKGSEHSIINTGNEDLVLKFQFSEQMIPLKHLHVVLIYLAVINVVTFFMYGIDKWKAKKSKWRIRETALLGLAVLGGSIGAWLGMKVWHHKTQHKGGNRDIDNIVGGYQFKYGVPAIIIIQLALIVYFIISKTI